MQQQTENCPKCGAVMDTGHMLVNDLAYVSHKPQTGFFSMPRIANLQNARACLTCGYLELYLKMEEVGKIATL